MTKYGSDRSSARWWPTPSSTREPAASCCGHFGSTSKGHATIPGPAAKGVGLGLALSREVAALLGGDLRARTSDGMGYEFTLVLHDYWCELGQPGQKIAV